MSELPKPLAVLLSVVVLGAAVQAQPCAGLDEETQNALAVLVAQYYPVPVSADCGMTAMYASESIIKQGSQAMPCLLHIYKHGLVETELWPLETPEPTDGAWVLTLISRIEPTTAVELYRARYTEFEGDPIERVRSAIALAGLGEQEYLEKLTEMLRNPPAVRTGKDSDLQGLLAETVEVIGQQHYKPALAVLQELAARGWTRNLRLPVYIAQLDGDVDVLQEFASVSGLSGTALRSLATLGRTDILEELATDPHYPYKKAAREVLANAG